MCLRNVETKHRNKIFPFMLSPPEEMSVSGLTGAPELSSCTSAVGGFVSLNFNEGHVQSSLANNCIPSKTEICTSSKPSETSRDLEKDP